MDSQKLERQIDEFITENRQNIIDSLGRLVAVRSVEDPATAGPGAPFGKGPRQALDTALAIAQELGLATNSGEGYLGWAELPGRQKEYLATIAHVDVVPEGEGWTGDPYTLREKEGWLLGRGVTDDKGPGVLCLYAAKFFKELGEEQPYTLRILLGCNEETGMKDVGHYLAHNPQPLFCFTPDADFPVCNGEKGHKDGSFVSPVLRGNLVEFAGGIANNVVPDRATCLVKADAAGLADTARVTVTAENGMARLHAKGVGGHAAMPQNSVNAIGLLVNYLLENNLATPEESRCLQLLQ
ncbi:MAG: Sapep family Mn(2+)-dependent dipeptidase [Oscillospiraceae bacterium]